MLKGTRGGGGDVGWEGRSTGGGREEYIDLFTQLMWTDQ